MFSSSRRAALLLLSVITSFAHAQLFSDEVVTLTDDNFD